MRVKSLAALAVLLLAGCAGAPQRTAPVVDKVLIQVPVRVPCEWPTEPVWAVDGLPIGAPIDEQVSALLAERTQARAYLGQIRQACQ